MVGPLQFWRGLRDRHRTAHRVLGRVYLSAVVLGGLSGLVLATVSEAGLAGFFGFGALACSGSSAHGRPTGRSADGMSRATARG